jgi:hypothetical protein
MTISTDKHELPCDQPGPAPRTSGGTKFRREYGTMNTEQQRKASARWICRDGEPWR